MRKLACLLVSLLAAGSAFAADLCKLTVETVHAHGDGVRLLATDTEGVYQADLPLGVNFAATVLADPGYVIAESGHTIPDGVAFDTTMGVLTIPASLIDANAESGITLKIAARPIVYSIRYHAHGDGIPDVDAGDLSISNEERSWLHRIDTADVEKTKVATVGTLHAEGWVFKGWSRIQGHTTPDFAPGEEIDHLTTKDNAVIKLFAVWDTTNEEGKVSYPVVLQNGDFESPVVSSNYYKFYAGAKITESEIQDPNMIGWSTTSKDNMVEIGNLSTAGAASQYNCREARDGRQIAELNANVAGLLFQRIATLPNQTLHWGFSHRARGSAGITDETMSMWIGSHDQIEQARAIYDRFALLDSSDENALTRDEAMAMIDELAECLQFTNVVHTATFNSDMTTWEDIKGDFVVPSERSITEYAFASWVVSTNGTASSYGNLLDRVYLSDSIPVEKYNLQVTLGEGGTVYINDSSALQTVVPGDPFFKTYDAGTRILLTVAAQPDFHYLGITTNGVFVARDEVSDIFKDISENGLYGDLAVDFIFASDALVQFRANGGSYTDAAGNEIHSEKLSLQRPTITLGEPTRTGYRFLGWRTKTGVIMESGAYVAFETDDNGEVCLVAYAADNTELVRNPSEDGLILYAQWEIDEDAIAQRQSWDVTMVAVNVDGDNTILKPVVGAAGTWHGMAFDRDDFITTVFANSGFRLPETIKVTYEDGQPIDGYLYNFSTGVIVIPGELVTGRINIEVVADRIRYTIIYSSGGTGEIEGEAVEKVVGSIGVWQQPIMADGETVTLASQGTLAAAGWEFLGWSRDSAATTAEYPAGAIVPHLTHLDLSVVKLYGIWKAEAGSTASSFPVSLENGSFERPSNELPPEGYNRNFYISYTEGVEGLNWYTTAVDSKIEIGSVSTNLNQSTCIAAYHTALARDGEQFAELNANKIGALYQDVATVPGTTLYWGFSHKAREEGDALALIIGSPEEFDKALAIYTEKLNSGATDWQQQVLDGIAALDSESLQVTYHLADYDVSDLVGWEDLTGEYKVPDGQNVTKFAFLSLSTNGDVSKGNLIDQVYFTTSEPVKTATLTVFVTDGGSAKVNDGLDTLTEASFSDPYFKVLAAGQRVVVSPMAEEGWTFLGLYSSTTFHPLESCDSYLNFEFPGENRKLTLLFAKDRTVTFNTEGGTYPDNSYRLSTTVSSYVLGTPVRSGYTFKGWRELTTGKIFADGDTVRYEVEAQYDENVHSYLLVGEGDQQVIVESESGLVLSAVWEISQSLVPKKLVTFVDRDYTSTEAVQPFKLLFKAYLGVNDTSTLSYQTGLKEIFNNTTTARPQGHEPTGWTYDPTDGKEPFDFDFILRVEHKSDSESTFFNVYGVTNGVYETFRFDGVESMRFIARWDRFYDVTRMEADGVTTNRAVWVPKSWLDEKGYTSITEENYKTDIEQSGANGIPLWQSYIFGLDPTNSISVALNRPFHLNPGKSATLRLDGVKVVKYLNDIYEAKNGSTLLSSWSGRDYRTYSVRFALMGADDCVNGPWTQVGDESDTPQFTVDPDTLVYRYYRIEGRVGPVGN